MKEGGGWLDHGDVNVSSGVGTWILNRVDTMAVFRSFFRCFVLIVVLVDRYVVSM